MTAERWAQIRVAVEAAVALPAEERSAYIREHYPDPEIQDEALRLLSFEDEAGQIFPVEAWREEATARIETALPEKMLGSYRLLRELGRGGMGTVYLAERAMACTSSR